MKRVVVFLADGFEDCEAFIVVDILRRAGVDVVMASVMGTAEVLSSRGIKVTADALADQIDYEAVDVIFLPGGRDGTENLEKSGIVREQCITFSEKKRIAAICAAPSILAHLGLLDGKKATCHPDYEDKMEKAVLTGESVVISGNIITGQALGAAFQLAFELVSILAGAEKEEQIKRAICYGQPSLT